MNKIMELYRRLRYGPHCLNQYTDDEIHTAALRLIPKTVADFGYYQNHTIESCQVMENEIATFRKVCQKEHPRMRKQLLRWMGYFERELFETRGRFKYRKIGDTWVSKDQVTNNIIRCVGR